MQKIICKKLYDTEAAELIKKVTVGAFGDANGYEECLYRLPEGNYFLYVNGGADSTMYYCECGKVNHATIEFNTEVEPVHEQ